MGWIAVESVVWQACPGLYWAGRAGGDLKGADGHVVDALDGLHGRAAEDGPTDRRTQDEHDEGQRRGSKKIEGKKVTTTD